LKFEGKSETLLVKDLQYDYLGKDVIHVDFMRVNLDEKADVNVMLEFKGTPAGVAEGGILDVHLDTIEVNCPVTGIPETIVLNVKELGIGDTIYAREITLPEGATLLTDGEMVIANCHVVVEKPEIEEGEEELEESAEPEVITEKNKDEE
jgi:large subunit ribosomal protein L25